MPRRFAGGKNHLRGKACNLRINRICDVRSGLKDRSKQKGEAEAPPNVLRITTAHIMRKRCAVMLCPARPQAHELRVAMTAG